MVQVAIVFFVIRLKARSADKNDVFIVDVEFASSVALPVEYKKQVFVLTLFEVEGAGASAFDYIIGEAAEQAWF